MKRLQPNRDVRSSFTDEAHQKMNFEAMHFYEIIDPDVPKNEDNKRDFGDAYHHWQTITGEYHPAKHQKRLAHEGLDERSFSTYIRTLDVPGLEDIKNGWTYRLERFINTWLAEGVPQVSLEAAEITFIDFYHCLAKSVLSEIAAEQPNIWPFLEEEGIASLEQGLRSLLFSIQEESLALEYQSFNATFYPSLWSRLNMGNESKASRLQHFYSYLFDENRLFTFFADRPFMARKTEIAVTSWKNNIVTFLKRLDADLNFLAKNFNEGRSIKKIKKLRCTVSDRHNGGLQVVLLQLDSGVKIVYKPKDLGLAWAFQNMVQWFNRTSNTEHLKAAKIYDREGYGWVEYIEHLEVKARAEINEFYYNCGVLLSLLYCLDASDCHYENVIVNGTFPVLIDLESLFHNYAPQEVRKGPNKDVGIEKIANSVIRTGFLPSWVMRGQDAYDVSPLGNTEEQEFEGDYKKLELSGDGLFHESKIKSKLVPDANVLLYDNTIIPCDDYVGDISTGFRFGCSFIMAHRDQLLNADGPLKQFYGKKSRLVFRPTQLYFDVLTEHNTEEYASDGLRAALSLDVLSFVHDEISQKHWELARREYLDLFNYDIPYFYCLTNSRDLFHDQEVIAKDFFDHPAYELVRERIVNLSEKVVESQVMFIKASIIGRRKFTAHAGLQGHTGEKLDFQKTNTPATTALVQESRSIAEKIMDAAITSDTIGATWLALEFNNEASKMQFRPIGKMLYNGSMGIALYMSALFSETKENRYKEFVAGIVNPILGDLNNPENNLHNELNTGGFAGLGGIIYACALISDFLDDDRYLHEALTLCRRIKTSHITADPIHDIVFGSAGFLLGLLRLQSSIDDPILHQWISTTTDYLIAKARTFPGDTTFRSWSTLDEGIITTGFSHGIAGICYALSKVDQRYPRPIIKTLVEKNFAYENSLLNNEKSNWKSFENGGQNLFSWCHGGIGIGISRCKMLKDHPAQLPYVKLALNALENYRLDYIDHLCCGNFGRLELLLTAAETMGNKRLIVDARSIAVQLIGRSKKNGGYNILSNSPKELNPPGLLQGLSGIGYQLLRLSDQIKYPNILMMD